MNTSLRPRCAVVLGLMGVCLGLAHVPPSLHAKPPLIVSVGGLSPEQVDVCFDQPVDRAVAQEAERYALGGGVEVIGARVLSEPPDHWPGRRIVSTESEGHPESSR